MHVFLETERLLLRRFTEADVDHLYHLDSDPAVMRFLSGGTPTPRAVIASEILPRFLRESDRYAGFGYWAAIERATSAFLGWFAFHPPDGGDPREIVLGYRLRKSAWGKGYATEGALALIRTGFTEQGVQRVLATTYEYNAASRRVMEKVGMTHIRSFRLTPADLAAERTFQSASDEVWEGNDVEYALEKADWERQQATTHRA